MSTVQRIKRFFLDESGNTGDVTGTGDAFDFHKQPVFVLGCLGIRDENAFDAFFADVKARHRLQGAEVKSDAAWKKPAFYMDLLIEIERLDLPLLLEVVDKRFFIAAQMVNTLILRPRGGDQDHGAPLAFIRNAIAEYITEMLPDACLDAYVAACAKADGTAILRVYEVLFDALDAEGEEGFPGFVRMVTVDARDAFLEAGPDNTAVVQARLPIPDPNHFGKLVWMLPHLSSLTNLYARLNTYTGGRLNDVTLVHDKQQEFEDILRTNKAAAEGLAAQGVEMTYGPANYVFRERADLTFVHSERSAGVQAIDVIAGYAMRLVVNRTTPGAEPRRDGDWQLRRLLDQDARVRGLGTNFVMTTAALRALDVADAPDPFLLPW